MHFLEKNLTKITDSISLKAKIQLVFFLFLIIPLLLFTLISYRSTNRLILNQTLSSMGQSYDECVSVLDRTFLSMSQTMDNLLSTPDIYQFTKTDSENPVFAQQAFYQRLNQLFGYMKKLSDIDRIRLYVENGSLHTENEQALLSLEHIENSDWYQSLLSQGKSRFWLSPGFMEEEDGSPSSCFSYVSILYSPENLTEPMGLMQIDISADKIRQILEEMAFSEEVSLYLTDKNRSFFDENGSAGDFSYDLVKLVESASSDPSAFFTLSSSGFASSANTREWEFVSYNGQSSILRRESLFPPQWYLTAVLPQNTVFHAQKQLYRDLLLELVIIGLVSYILACLTANSSLKRLLLLNTEIKKMEAGNFQIKLPHSGKDEIGEIIDSFSSMSRRMECMINERYEMGRAVKNAELCALQAQINPHFLYNSLDLINCIAIRENVPQITEMVSALVKFYKLTLNSGHEIVTLSQELLHVKTYVRIQNIRFVEKIRFSCNQPEWLTLYTIPKILLQPLVENAIIHGILESPTQTGSVSVLFSREMSDQGEEEIRICVEDDGVGIPPHILDKILKEDCLHKGSGYGVKNVNERIQLFYGERFGLSYESTRPGGTKVTVRIPAVRSLQTAPKRQESAENAVL